MGLEVGLIGLVILIADVWAIIKTVQSGASTGRIDPYLRASRTASLAARRPQGLALSEKLKFSCSASAAGQALTLRGFRG